MKSLKKIYLILLGCYCFGYISSLNTVYGQPCNVSSTGPGYINAGWMRGGNTATQPANKSNRLGTGSPLDTPLVIITHGIDRMIVSTDCENGYVGIGNNFLHPTSNLHIHGSTNSPGFSFVQWTNSSTGNGAADGIKIGNKGLNAEFRQQEEAPIYFFQGQNVNAERIRIDTDMPLCFGCSLNHPDETRVSINYGAGLATGISSKPVSLLNLGEDRVSQQAGTRSWMEVGTFYSQSTDHMYVGLKKERTGTDRADAVINWGDNPFKNTLGPDNLRFIFSTGGGLVHPGSVDDGIEVARITPDGMTGIGDFYTSAIQPLRRFEVLTDFTHDPIDGDPQFRMTHTQDANILQGIHVDFHSTSTGDLLINPTISGVAGNLGIGLSTAALPTQTIDVNGNGRFRGITSGTNDFLVTGENNGTLHKLLFDGNSNHSLLGDGTWGPCCTGGGNACALINIVPKTINASGDLDCSQIYDDGVFVGIATTTPILNTTGTATTKLNVNGDITMSNYNNEFHISDKRILSFGNSAGGFFTTLIAGHRDANAAIIDDPENTVVGYNAGYNMNDGWGNTFMGSHAGQLTNHVNAVFNTFVGLQSGRDNLEGTCNTYVGVASGAGNSLGNYNCAFGSEALGNLTTGSENTSMGWRTAISFYDGNRNTFLGSTARALTLGGGTIVATNAAAIGAYANVCESNTMVFGSASNSLNNSLNPDYVERWGFGTCPALGHALEFGVLGAPIPNGEGSFIDNMGLAFNPSDRNLKENFHELDGDELLNKITQLPVPEWNFKRQKNVRHVGPMAQDFWQLFKLGHNDISLSSSDVSGVALAGVKQLIKQNEEINKQLESKDTEIKSLKDEMQSIKNKLTEFEGALTECCMHFENKSQTENSSDHASLEQNVPNPFNEKTVIKYYVPQSSSSALIKVYALDGAALKTFSISQKGTGEVEISGNTLAPGTYVYHLVVDGKQIDGKLMTLTK